MRLLFTLLAVSVIAIYSPVAAQNMVMNPSFETFPGCPQGPSEFSNTTNWQDPFQNFIGDTCSTSDIYASCAPFGAFGVGVPDNVMGSQPAHTGNGYAGIILYEGFTAFGCTSLFGSNWREYAEGQLTAPLVAGQDYCVSFWVSLADNVKWSTDDIGVYFSNSLVNISCGTVGNSVLPYTPQLEYTGPDLDNSNGWTELTWTYTAAGGEQYLTIGNFKDDSNTSYNCANESAFNPYSYYYIDDVSVEPGGCSVECAISATIQSTQEDCVEGGTATITATAANGSGSYSYNWGGSGTGSTLTGVSSGTYTVVVSDNSLPSCSITESITIDILQPVVAEAGVNDTICKGETGELIASGGGTYAWDTGAQGASLVLGPGATTTYEVTVTGTNGCTDTDMATMVVYDVPSALVETQSQTVCDNAGPITLGASPAGGEFSGPGVTGNSFDPAAAGVGEHIIWYAVGDFENCLGMDSVVITVDICTSLSERENAEVFRIYPNPANTVIHIDVSDCGFLGLENINVRIYSVSGKLVMNETTVCGSTLSMKTDGLAAGLYNVAISDNQGNSWVEKVQVVR